MANKKAIKLQVFEQEDSLLVHQQHIHEGATVRIGRNPEFSDLKKVRLADPRISQLHMSLLFTGDTVVVTDLASTNGVWLDGKLFRDEAVEVNLNDSTKSSLSFYAGSPQKSKYKFVLKWDAESNMAPATIECTPEGTIFDDDDDELFEFSDEFDPGELNADSVRDSVSTGEDSASSDPSEKQTLDEGGKKTKSEHEKE